MRIKVRRHTIYRIAERDGINDPWAGMPYQNFIRGPNS